MKTVRSICLLLSLGLAAPALAGQQPPAAPAKAEGTALDLVFVGITAPTGAIMAAVFDSEAAYSGGQPVRAVRIPVSGPRAAERIEGLAPGSYAVKAFHDIDGDGKMGTNPFGTPIEPFAFSNDAPAEGGPPAWGAARFEAGAGTATHTITIK